MPPSQYGSPSMRTAPNAGGSAPDAITWSTPSGSLAAVEVAHRAAADVDRADGQARPAVAEVAPVDQRAQRLAQRRGAVVRRAARRRRGLACRAAPRRLGVKNDGMPRSTVVIVPSVGAEAERVERARAEALLLDLVPERVQPLEPVRRRVAADQRRVDRADRRADHPVGLDAGLVQRLVDADLVGAERAAALQHEHDLARQRWLSSSSLPSFLAPRRHRHGSIGAPSTTGLRASGAWRSWSAPLHRMLVRPGARGKIDCGDASSRYDQRKITSSSLARHRIPTTFDAPGPGCLP